MKLTILSIDDNPNDSFFLMHFLEEITEWGVQFLMARNLEEAQGILESSDHVDIIFLDLMIGGNSGVDLLREVRFSGEDLPIIVLTGQGSERLAAESMRAGADDYIIKDDLTSRLLRDSISMVLGRFEHRSRRAKLEAELFRLASTDALTNLDNRRAFMQKLQVECLRARRYFSRLSIIMLDADFFKQVNDNHGHQVGDSVLARVGTLIGETCRNTDFAARYGGEEFCVGLPLTSSEGAQLIAERLREALSREVFVGKANAEFHVTCSLGVAEMTPETSEVNALLKCADDALYQAKNNGRNCTVVAPLCG